MKQSVKKVWNFIFNLFCIIGCAYQIQSVVWSYFKYGTVTKNRYFSPEYINFPELHYCFRYIEDALDWNAVERKYRKVVLTDPKNRKTWTDILTIGDIFEYTPDSDITQCLYRDPTGHSIISSRMGECNFFNVEKYVFQQFICYRVTPKEQIKVDFEFIPNSLNYERLLYQIRYVGRLANATKMRPTITGYNYPFISRLYASGYFKNSDEDMTLHISCQRFENSFLGYPYDKFVCEQHENGYYDCFDSCMKKFTMTTLDRLPYATFHTMPHDSKLISYSMLKNKTIRHLLTDWWKKCVIHCPMFSCSYSYCVTIGYSDTHTRVKRTERGSKIRVESPTHPNIYINYFPSVPLLDCIIYILSSLGTWFGLVIISCNPVSFISSVTNRIEKKKVPRSDLTDVVRHQRKKRRIIKYDIVGDWKKCEKTIKYLRLKNYKV